MTWTLTLKVVLIVAAIIWFTNWLCDKEHYEDSMFWWFAKWTWLILLVTTILWGVSNA